MRTTWSVTTAPASEPISTADAKTWLNVSTSLHDTLIANLISAGRVWYEKETGWAVITQTITQVWDCLPYRELELNVGNATAITTFKYLDTAGALTTWSSANYSTDFISQPSRVVRLSTVSWPLLGDFPNCVQIAYTAGYANAAAVPEDIINAIMLMVSFWYENREDIPVSETNNPKIRSAAAIANAKRISLF